MGPKSRSGNIDIFRIRKTSREWKNQVAKEALPFLQDYVFRGLFSPAKG
jgi:hypothetical protein